MNLLGIDVGTTNIKAGLIARDGTIRRIATRPTPIRHDADGHPEHDPEAIWSAVRAVVREAAGGERIEVAGITSMAEAGLLIDAETGEARTAIIPWFDPRSTPQAERVEESEGALTLFERTGLRISFKHGLAKLLWLQEHRPEALPGSRWLSVADYIVFRLTGRMATDPTLAARTCVFSLADGIWDRAWIASFGLEPDLFPAIQPSGTPAGESLPGSPLPAGTPCAVAGHDHLCTLLAAGITAPGPVLDSMGTAESLLGVMADLHLDERAFCSGLAIVPHVLPGRWCWLGGLSSAGGSLEWLRHLLGDPPLDYEALMRLAEAAGPEPTGLLYFPYLAGSGAPCPDQHVRGAVIGLSAATDRATVVKAILEGMAYELEAMRRAAEELTGDRIDRVIAVGGGTRYRAWLQIKADLAACPITVPDLPEATVLGAALTAGLGSGLLDGQDEIEDIAARRREAGRTGTPDQRRHEIYEKLYTDGYSAFQQPLRRWAVATRPREGAHA